MHRFRRHDDAVRLEMTPLIDVVFLLLTFFIFSMVVMVRANVLPVELVGLGTGAAAENDAVAAITLDTRGQIYFNRDPLSREDLRAELEKLVQQPAPPRLYVAVEAGEGDVDRGPLLLELMEMIREAGVDDVAFVGPPTEAGL